MTSWGVNWEGCRGLIQTDVLCATVGASGRCPYCDYQPSWLFSNTTLPPKPPPHSVPFSFKANPSHPHPTSIFVWQCLLPSPCSQQKLQRDCWSVLGMEKWTAVSESKQTAIIYSPPLERSHYLPNKMVYDWFEASWCLSPLQHHHFKNTRFIGSCWVSLLSKWLKSVKCVGFTGICVGL